MQRILDGIHQFQTDVFPRKQPLFKRLAQGQQPEALFVACSDSRLALDLLTQTGPGDLFVCRNAGNIVPAHGQTDAVSATIEYAVSALRVKHIVVCGHSDCGAMKGLLNPDTLAAMPHVKNWLRHSDGAYRALGGLRIDPRSPAAIGLVTRLSVVLQLDHLRTHPEVFAGIQEGTLQIHGWVYDIETGDVQAWVPALQKWKALSDVSPLSPQQVATTAPPEVLHA